jgi:hypothetical protein
VPDRKRRSLGRDPFEDANESSESGSVKKLIRGKSPLQPDPREVELRVKLTPANLKHLDQVQTRVAARGRSVSRDELIRIAIALLTAEDVS